MKTAVRMLLEHLDKYDIQLYKSVEEEFLETEKNQIKKAYNEGFEHADEIGSEEYYNETYQTNKETLK